MGTISSFRTVTLPDFQASMPTGTKATVTLKSKHEKVKTPSTPKETIKYFKSVFQNLSGAMGKGDKHVGIKNK